MDKESTIKINPIMIMTAIISVLQWIGNALGVILTLGFCGLFALIAIGDIIFVVRGVFPGWFEKFDRR